jgi:hypothetical protein
LIEAYGRAYQTAELDERVARIEQLKLMRIAYGNRDSVEQRARKLLPLNPRWDPLDPVSTTIRDARLLSPI